MNQALHPVDFLVRRLAERPAPTSSDLVELLRELPEPEALATWARFADDRYVRTSLFHGRDHEIRLLGWKPGQSSTLHGHGPSACAFRVVSGVATEIRLDGTIRELYPGDIAMDGDGGVHQVSNLGDVPLVTVHLYAPPLPVDQPSTESGHRVAIIGGGFTGVALAIQLLEVGDPSLRISIVERGPHIGRGPGFSTTDPTQLCEIPAGEASLDPDEPDEFVSYAIARGVAADRRSFLPRALYGDYVVDRLGRVLGRHPGRLRLVRAEAVDLEGREDGFVVHLGDGRRLVVDDVLLATGLGTPGLPPGLEGIAQETGLLRDPTRPGALRSVPRSARVLLVGTGSAALDVLLTLRANQHEGTILAVSPDGAWPTPHASGSDEHWEARPLHASPTADELAAWVDAERDRALLDRVPWPVAHRAIREVLAERWSTMGSAERARWVERGHRTWWQRYRPLAPPNVVQALARWAVDGWVETRAATFREAGRLGDGLVVALSDGTEFRADRVIACLDPSTDVVRYDSPWWRSLIRRGWVRPSPEGVVTTEDGRTVSTQSAGSLWALGGVASGTAFDRPTVADLVRRARRLARNLTAKPRRAPMSLHLGSTAPDFTADTTDGPLRFYEWAADRWVVLFSHPKDFTPVCTTELAAVARMLGAFEQRKARPLAISVDTVQQHLEWVRDIEETQGVAPNYPIIGDPDRRIARLYEMVPPDGADGLTVRSVFFIDPSRKIRAILTYPASTGRNFDEILRLLDSLQLTDQHKVATPANWHHGEDVVIVPSLVDPEELAVRFPKGWRALRPYLRITPQP